MNDTSHARGREAPAESRSTGSLRLRIWVACLGGALLGASGVWWVIGTQVAPGELDLARVVSWLGAVAGLSVVAGAAFALWLDHGVVTQARGLTQAVGARQIARLRGLPASAGWGELSQLTQQVQNLVSEHRVAERDMRELLDVREQLGRLEEALRRWNDTEQWAGVSITSGPARSVSEALGRGLERLEEVREQNLEAVRQVATEVERTAAMARESSEQAEAGFVEATALLTTLRELHRLQIELSYPADAADAVPPVFEAATMAREAIEELAAGSTRAVEHLGRGLQRLEAIAQQVTRIANRATLIALQGGTASALTPGEDLAEESRRLVADIREAVDRTGEVIREVDAEVTAATVEMRELRARVAERLTRLPQVAPRGADADARRLHDRIREMAQDATRKGERLSSGGERASRNAEALVHALEAERRELEGLQVRLAPPGLEPAGESAAPGPPAGRSLRMLGPQDVLDDAAPLERPAREPR